MKFNNRKELIKNHKTEYQEKLNDLIDKIDIDVFENITSILIQAYKNEKTIYVAGNGGSAATASHYKADFNFFIRYFKEKRFKIQSLTDHTPLMTAISNDTSYDEVFTQQMQDYFDKGDVLIAISASGNSTNVVKAAEYASELAGTSIGLVGFDGGELKEKCDICLHTPNKKGDYGPIEDLHMIICHMMVTYLRKDDEFMNI